VADAHLSASPDELRARLAATEQELAQVRQELEQTRASTSFRVGHALVRTAGRLARRRPASPPRPSGTARATSTREATEPSAPADPGAAGTDTDVVPGPTTPTSRLLDATGVDETAAIAAARSLLADGGRLTVVHPETLDLDDPSATVVAADRVTDDLAARFGPARTLRAVPTAAARPPALLVREVQPLVQVVAEDVDAGGLPSGPVFIGGTGRSGTWVLGRMFAQHPRFAYIHTELRFHATPPGFAGVLAGDLTPDEFAEHVHRKWFRPSGGKGTAKGLQLIIGNREIQAILRDFRERAADDVPGALGQLMLDVTAPYARGRFGLRWAETTPDNAAAAAALTTVLPDAHVVHTVRDGRDVAASVVTMPWGPATHLEALDWWAGRLRAAHLGVTAADPDRVHTVRLEELLHLDRDRTLDTLLDRLGFTDDERLRTYFDRKMSAEHGHVGRWRAELDAAERDAFDRRYRELLAALADEGVTCLPADPDAVDELAGGA
jgi:hypothetical protein